MEKSTWMKIVIVGLLLALAGAAYFYFTHNVSTVPNSFIGASPLTRALVIDMSADGEISYSDFLRQNDAVVVLHHGVTPKDHSDDIIERQQLLAAFDHNHDGAISPQDPIYSKLELAFLVKTNGITRINYKPISQTGIRSLYLDKKYVSEMAQTRSGKIQNVAGTVVMADGSKRLIRDVIIDESWIK